MLPRAAGLVVFVCVAAQFYVLPRPMVPRASVRFVDFVCAVAQFYVLPRPMVPRVAVRLVVYACASAQFYVLPRSMVPCAAVCLIVVYACAAAQSYVSYGAARGSTLHRLRLLPRSSLDCYKRADVSMVNQRQSLFSRRGDRKSESFASRGGGWSWSWK